MLLALQTPIAHADVHPSSPAALRAAPTKVRLLQIWMESWRPTGQMSVCEAEMNLERGTGLEPATSCLGIRCTADAARGQIERLERGTGFEPATSCLEGRSSTAELPPRRKQV